MTDPLKKGAPPAWPPLPSAPGVFRTAPDVFAALAGGASSMAPYLRDRMTHPGYPGAVFGPGSPFQAAAAPILQEMRQMARRAGDAVDARLDRAVHEGADAAFEHVRGLKMQNLAWYQVQQKMFNMGVDMVADHGPAVVRATCGFARDVRQRVGRNLAERADPYQLRVAFEHPQETATYFRQKVQPLVHLAALADNPRQVLGDMARQAPARARKSAGAVFARIGELDKQQASFAGFRFNYPDPRHAARAGLDWGEDTLATAIGVTLVSKLFYLSPSARKNTREMSQRIVSNARLQGKIYRYPVRFTVNGFARMANNKQLTAAIATYWAVTAAGNAIMKSRELRRVDPTRYAQLEKDGRHLKGAATTASITDAIKKTSHE